MIDIENYIVSQISSALSSAYSSTYPGLVVYSTEVEIPESFPCVTVVASEGRDMGLQGERKVQNRKWKMQCGGIDGRRH